MKTVERCSDESVLEQVVALLRERVERYGVCQVSGKRLQNLVAEIIGVTVTDAKWVSRDLAKRLLEKGFMRVWSVKRTSNGYKYVYQLVPDTLLGNN